MCSSRALVDRRTVAYDATMSGSAAGCGVEVAVGPDGVRVSLNPFPDVVISKMLASRRKRSRCGVQARKSTGSRSWSNKTSRPLPSALGKSTLSKQKRKLGLERPRHLKDGNKTDKAQH